MSSGKNQIGKEQQQCTICIERPSNSSLDGCNHQFCLRCIKKWAKVSFCFTKNKNSCPLCRERFFHITCRKKVIEVEPVLELTQPPRRTQPPPPSFQSRVMYIPVFVYPPSCFFYPQMRPQMFQISQPFFNFSQLPSSLPDSL